MYKNHNNNKKKKNDNNDNDSNEPPRPPRPLWRPPRRRGVRRSGGPRISNSENTLLGVWVSYGGGKPGFGRFSGLGLCRMTEALFAQEHPQQKKARLPPGLI